MEKKKLIQICPDIGLDFGRTRVIHSLVEYISEQNTEFNIILATNKESDLTIFGNLCLEVVYIPISLNKRNIFKFFAALLKLVVVINKKKIEIIHSHHRYTDLLSFLVSKLTNINSVSTIHSFTKDYNKISYLNDKIVCVSNSVKNFVLEAKQIDYKIHVIYNGIKFPRVTSKLSSSNAEKKINLLCIARVDYDKGIDILLDALEILWDQNKNINLTLVGEYSKVPIRYNLRNEEEIRKKFKQKVQKKIEKYSEKISIINSKYTPWKLISETDVIIIPSRIESFGLVAIEAGMLKKCVIASDTGGLKEIIKNQENGLIFETENSVDLSKKILFLSNNMSLVSSCGENLYNDVKNKYTSKIMSDNYLEVYKELLNTN